VLNFDARQIAGYLPYDQLIDALDAVFREDPDAPDRVHYGVPAGDSAPGTLLLMPAWREGAVLGVKIATVFPDNARLGLPAVHASYVLMDANTGVPQAVMDGTELTLRRTACASALASRFLAREDAHRLLMVGTGNLAPHLVRAHSAVRPLTEIIVWGRRRAAAEAVAASLADLSARVIVADDLQAATGEADIISCATLADRPMIEGAWLAPGQHLDLVGAFTPQMSEANPEAVAAAEVFVDTYAGATAEAGDLIKAASAGCFSLHDIRADLAELAQGRHPGRKTPGEITLFKSVGAAIEDLAAAQLVMQSSDS